MSRGHDRERQVRDHLLEHDWVVIRAAGSLGCVDLVALKAGETPRLIEVKSTAGGPYERFSPGDRADLSLRAAWGGASAWLAWWPPRGTLRWIPEAEWPTRATPRRLLVQVDPDSNPDYVMGPEDDVPRLATSEERELLGLPPTVPVGPVCVVPTRPEQT